MNEVVDVTIEMFLMVAWSNSLRVELSHSQGGERLRASLEGRGKQEALGPDISARQESRHSQPHSAEDLTVCSRDLKDH